MKFQLGDWTFDLYSSLITLGVMPIVLYILSSLRKLFSTVSRYAIDGFLQGLSRIANQKVAARISLKRYGRLQLSGPTRHLNVPGKTNETFLDIDEIYVPLVLERAGSLQTFGHNEVTTLGNRIRITGDPGSGKSTFAKRLFRDECVKAIEHPDTARFPLLVELRRLEFPKNTSAKKLGDWLYNHLLEVVRAYDIYEPERCFSAYAVSSGLLVILDGLDEVSAAVYQQAEAAINSISSKLEQLGSNNVVVLTMRTQFHLQIWRAYVESFPISLSLKRFSPTDIYSFLVRWPFDHVKKIEHVIRIYNDLTDRPALREMCTNPLILSMYVAQDQASGHQLTPESRSSFYKQVTEELLIRRRAKQLGPSDVQTVLRRQRERILGKIAFEHLCNGDQPANLIPWEDGKRIAAEIMGLRDTTAAEKLLRNISTETGLISEEREGESFRFIHLTFCEFLAALEATQGRGDGWDVLRQRHVDFSKSPRTRTRLAEVIPFAASLLPEHSQFLAIEHVSDLGDSHTLALTFLETKRYEHPIWQSFINRYRNVLVQRSNEDWSPEWLAEVHLFLVVASDANRSAGLIRGIEHTNVITLFFQHFADDADENLIKLIASYAEQDAASAFRVSTLCGIDVLSKLPTVVVDNVDQPAFLAITIERAARDEDAPERWAALLAEAGLRSPAAAALLINSNQRPWIDLARSLPEQHQWQTPGIVPDSLYSDCLTIAHASILAEPHLRLTSFFSKLKSPRAQTMQSFYARFVRRNFDLIAFIIYLGVAIAFVPGLFLPSHYYQYGASGETTINIYYLTAFTIFAIFFCETLFVLFYSRLEKQTQICEQILNFRSEIRSRKMLQFFRIIPNLFGSLLTKLLPPHPLPIADITLPEQLENQSFVVAGEMFLSVRKRVKTDNMVT